MTLDSGLSNSQRSSLLAHCYHSHLAPENSTRDPQMHSETSAGAGPFLVASVQDMQYSTNASNTKERQSLAAWQLILLSVFTRKRNDQI